MMLGAPSHRAARRSDAPFIASLVILGGVYVVLIVAMVLAEAFYTSWGGIVSVLRSPSLQYAIWLSLVSCTITTIVCLWVAVPLAYLMSRWEPATRAGRYAKLLVDGIIDIPIVLPPLVVGLCLLILFQSKPLLKVQEVVPVTYRIPSIIIAQFTVSCAFAVRALRVTFDGLGARREQVALTLGCSRGQAFWLVTLPEARRGLLTAATLAWARALGEFGPILVFSRPASSCT
jgi:molybdate transport system permease protein